MAKKFQRKKEDFRCRHCGFLVEGSGYTNHCPECLWSRHVDMNPGDRAETCRGMMEPVGMEMKGSSRVIIHRCGVCHVERKNKVAEDDSADEIARLFVCAQHDLG